MKAEEVPAEMAEKVANGFLSRLDLGDASPREVQYMQAVLAAVLPEIRARALRDAADEWQTREWANVPRRADRVADRLGAAQHVCDWLRRSADRLRGTTAEGGGA